MGLLRRFFFGIVLIFCSIQASAQQAGGAEESVRIPLQLFLTSPSDDIGIQTVPPTPNSAPQHKFVKLPLIDAVITQVDEETLRVELETPVRYNSYSRDDLSEITSSFIKTFQVSTSFLNIARVMELSYSDYVAFNSFKEAELVMALAHHEISGADQSIIDIVSDGPIAKIVRPKMLSFSIQLEQLGGPGGVTVSTITLAGELVTDPLDQDVKKVDGIVSRPIDQVFASYAGDQGFISEYVQAMSEVRARLEELESRNWLGGFANGNWKHTKSKKKLIAQSDNVVRLPSKKLCRAVFN